MARTPVATAPKAAASAPRRAAEKEQDGAERPARVRQVVKPEQADDMAMDVVDDETLVKFGLLSRLITGHRRELLVFDDLDHGSRTSIV